MVNRHLREAVREALKERGRGFSDRTMQYDVVEIMEDCSWATRNQAWLVYAKELGIDIRKYEDNKEELKEVNEILKMRTASAPAIQQVARPRRKRTVAKVSEPSPRESFDFVSDPKIRAISQRDYKELGKVRSAKACKSTIILSGGLLEAWLSDALSRRPDEAKASYKKLYPEKKRVNWTLECLIGIAEDLEIITPGATQLSQTLREYRNLVHPEKEIKSGYKVEKEEAEIAFNMVQIVMRDLKNP